MPALHVAALDCSRPPPELAGVAARVRPALVLAGRAIRVPHRRVNPVPSGQPWSISLAHKLGALARPVRTHPANVPDEDEVPGSRPALRATTAARRSPSNLGRSATHVPKAAVSVVRAVSHGQFAEALAGRSSCDLELGGRPNCMACKGSGFESLQRHQGCHRGQLRPSPGRPLGNPDRRCRGHQGRPYAVAELVAGAVR